MSFELFFIYYLPFYSSWLIIYLWGSVLPPWRGREGKQAWTCPAPPRSPCIPRRVHSSPLSKSTVPPHFWAPGQANEYYCEGGPSSRRWPACAWWWRQWHSWILQTPGNRWEGRAELRAPVGEARASPTSASLVPSLSRYPTCRTPGKLNGWPGPPAPMAGTWDCDTLVEKLVWNEKCALSFLLENYNALLTCMTIIHGVKARHSINGIRKDNYTPPKAQPKSHGVVVICCHLETEDLWPE